MLDKRSLALLNEINNQCLNSGYKVLSIGELMESLPKEFGSDYQSVLDSLKALTEMEYISIKYQDDKEVCVCPKIKGRLVFETRIDEQIERQRLNKSFFICSLLGSLTGGVLAGLITSLLIILIGGA